MTTTVLDSIDELDAYYANIAEHFNTAADYHGLLTTFLQKMETLHDQFFAAEAGPSRVAWPPLAQSTIDRKGHDTILYETGRLRSSLAGQTGDSIREIIDEGMNWGISYGTSVPYSIFHQDGTGKLPQREHVGIGDKELTAITQDVAERTLEIVQEA